MTKTEEAALRTAIAEREMRLARLLQTPGHITVDQCLVEEMRRGIERLRRELLPGGGP